MRDWAQARRKVEREGVCRHCESIFNLEAAHIVPRSRLRSDEGAEDQRNIIPLCTSCHRSQHEGRLELLPLLTFEEQGYAASLVGIEEARRRTTKAAA